MRKLHPVAKGIIFGTFLARAGFFMSLPFLGIYLHEVKGYTPSITGAVLAVSFLISTFSSYFGGSLSDRLGRYPLMMASIYVWGGVFIGFAFANQVWQFFLLNALNGLCRSFFEPAARALLADVTPLEQRTDVFNLRYFAINIGAGIGPIIGLLIGRTQSAFPFLISAIIYLFYGCFIVIWSRRFPFFTENLEQEKPSFVSSLKIISKDKVFRFFLIGNIFVTGAYAHIDTTLSQYMGSQHAGTFTILFMTNSVTILLLQFPIIRMMKKYTPLTALKLGSIVFALGIFGFGISYSLPILIISMLLFTIGEILCFIIGDVLISEIAPAQLRATYFGAAGLQFIGQGGASWLGGWLLSYFGLGNGTIVFVILYVLKIVANNFFQFGQYLSSKKIVNEVTM
jgi:MFS family permease